MRHLEGVALTIPVKTGTMNPKLKALGAAIDALQKQTPSPVKVEDGLHCPSCGRFIAGKVPPEDIRPLYCGGCGQAFCWCSTE